MRYQVIGGLCRGQGNSHGNSNQGVFSWSHISGVLKNAPCNATVSPPITDPKLESSDQLERLVTAFRWQIKGAKLEQALTDCESRLAVANAQGGHKEEQQKVRIEQQAAQINTNNATISNLEADLAHCMEENEKNKQTISRLEIELQYVDGMAHNWNRALTTDVAVPISECMNGDLTKFLASLDNAPKVSIREQLEQIVNGIKPEQGIFS